MPRDHLTKPQKRALRQLAAIGHERELGAALTELERHFGRWRNGELNVFELNEHIHAFHQGPSRELYNSYDGSNLDLAVQAAIIRGAIEESEIPEVIADLMASAVELARTRR